MNIKNNNAKFLAKIKEQDINQQADSIVNKLNEIIEESENIKGDSLENNNTENLEVLLNDLIATSDEIGKDESVWKIIGKVLFGKKGTFKSRIKALPNQLSQWIMHKVSVSIELLAGINIKQNTLQTLLKLKDVIKTKLLELEGKNHPIDKLLKKMLTKVLNRIEKQIEKTKSLKTKDMKDTLSEDKDKSHKKSNEKDIHTERTGNQISVKENLNNKEVVEQGTVNLKKSAKLQLDIDDKNEKNSPLLENKNKNLNNDKVKPIIATIDPKGSKVSLNDMIAGNKSAIELKNIPNSPKDTLKLQDAAGRPKQDPLLARESQAISNRNNLNVSHNPELNRPISNANTHYQSGQPSHSNQPAASPPLAGASLSSNATNPTPVVSGNNVTNSTPVVSVNNDVSRAQPTYPPAAMPDFLSSPVLSGSPFRNNYFQNANPVQPPQTPTNSSLAPIVQSPTQPQPNINSPNAMPDFLSSVRPNKPTLSHNNDFGTGIKQQSTYMEKIKNYIKREVPTENNLPSFTAPNTPRPSRTNDQSMIK